METYAYVRVSSKDQNPERQLIAMRELLVPEQNIFLDRETGKDFERPAYEKMVGSLNRGDLIIIKSIDRLGRNYEDIKQQWEFITKEIGANIRVLDMPLLNTATDKRDLTGVFIADLVLQILAYVAETERIFIRQRQMEGIRAAKERGIRFGRKRINLPEGFERCYQEWKNGTLSVRKAADRIHMSPATFYRRCRERLEKEIERFKK